MIKRLGQVEKVYLCDQFAKGLDSPIIDLIMIGDIDKEYLRQFKVIKRKVRYLIYEKKEFTESLLDTFVPMSVLLWSW